MSRLKIVRVITRLNIGGPAQQAVLLADPKANKDWETVLLSGHPEVSEGNMEYLLKNRNIQFLRILPLQRKPHPWKDLKALWLILRCLLKEKPDVLHTHTAKAGALGRMAGWLYQILTRRPLRIVHTFHGHIFEGYFNWFNTRFFQLTERWLARRSGILIAINQALRQNLLDLKIAPASKIEVVPLGLPLEHLLKLSLPTEGPPLQIGIVGRLVPIKNVDLFLKAAQILHDGIQRDHSKFLVIGDGECRVSLECRAQELQILDCVQFLGWKKDLPEIYRQLQVVCLTSRNEGTPVSLIEALAAGRPVVATDVGGVRELLRGSGCREGTSTVAQGSYETAEHGILIPSNDPSSLAKALGYLISNPQVARSLGERGRHFVEEQFDLSKLVQNLDRLYRQAA